MTVRRGSLRLGAATGDIHSGLGLSDKFDDDTWKHGNGLHEGGYVDVR